MTERHRLATDTDNGLLLIVSGPSGVGKTTITRGIERSIPDAIFSVSVTTRDQTDADIDGVDYKFVSDEQFDEFLDADALLEHANVYGRRYGTRRTWVEEQLARGRLVILEIDVQGAKQVKAKMPDAFAIFILPPSEEELLNRLRSREREDDAQIAKRFAKAQAEIDSARSSDVYDLFIVNADLDRAITQAVESAQARRRQTT